MTIEFSPNKNTRVVEVSAVETNPNNPEETIAQQDGSYIIPEGMRALFSVIKDNQDHSLQLDDYRSRPGHEPGAQVKIDKKTDSKLNSETATANTIFGMIRFFNNEYP